MATGIVAVLGSSASVTYIPTSNAKVKIVPFTSGAVSTLTINGVGMTIPYGANSSSASSEFEIYVGANSSLTVVTASSISAIVSAIEEV